MKVAGTNAQSPAPLHRSNAPGGSGLTAGKGRFIREVGALRTLEFSSKANRKNGWGGMDCGSLLPLSGGQPAGRRASNGIRIFHRSRSGGSHIIFSITQGLRRRQAAAVQDMPLSQVSEDSMLLHRTNFPDEPKKRAQARFRRPGKRRAKSARQNANLPQQSREREKDADSESGGSVGDWGEWRTNSRTAPTTSKTQICAWQVHAIG